MKKSKVLLAVVLIVVVLAVASAVATPNAQAWPWSSKVVLNGSITAPWSINNAVT